MNAPESPTVIRQHLIDPEICIRCNSCEEACPIHAITHDSRNYVVNPDVCASCRACIPVCPTGAIDNWHPVLKASAYSLEAQLSWDELPPLQDLVVSAAQEANSGQSIESKVASDSQPVDENLQTNAATSTSSAIPPWSAAHPYLNLYTLKAPVVATVAGNYRLTEANVPSDIHHIVLDFGNKLFPILEGQSIGIIPPGTDANGKPHYIRMYSVASPRNGERDGFNNLSLTVKRVVEDHDGNPVDGVASNYLCDLVKGAVVQVTGPFGANALMPNHPDSNILMVCTGTGSAPMRAMTEYRRRLRVAGRPLNGKLMLFFGARNPEELPYFGPLLKLPDDFIIKHFAFSRVPEQPKAYVQDKIREVGAAVVDVLKGDTYVYICGLKGMEIGVMTALTEVCSEHGMDWPALQAKMVDSGRFHVETY